MGNWVDEPAFSRWPKEESNLFHIEKINSQSERMGYQFDYLIERAGFVKEMMVYELE
ncbi:hypothetical protein MUP95_09505 [bacterium]|nr:hypothetical protein [bacterium]